MISRFGCGTCASSSAFMFLRFMMTACGLLRWIHLLQVFILVAHHVLSVYKLLMQHLGGRDGSVFVTDLVSSTSTLVCTEQFPVVKVCPNFTRYPFLTSSHPVDRYCIQSVVEILFGSPQLTHASRIGYATFSSFVPAPSL